MANRADYYYMANRAGLVETATPVGRHKRPQQLALPTAACFGGPAQHAQYPTAARQNMMASLDGCHNMIVNDKFDTTAQTAGEVASHTVWRKGHWQLAAAKAGCAGETSDAQQ
jgi:hypothetical protein